MTVAMAPVRRRGRAGAERRCGRRRSRAAADPAPCRAGEPGAPAAPADLVMNELHSMRGMLEEQLASVVWNDTPSQDPVRGSLLRTLLGAGFSAKLSKAMLREAAHRTEYAEGMAFARAELIRAVPVHEDEDACWRRAACTRSWARPASARPPPPPSWRPAA